MKQIFLLIGIAVSISLNAQNNNVVSAYNYMNDGDYDKAVEYIEPAISNESTAVKEKTWRYRGSIYAHIATGNDEALKAKYPQALQLAIDSYSKANELDTKGSYKEENLQAMASLQVNALNSGNEAYTAQDYDLAIAKYAQSQQLAKAFGLVDSNAVFNTALAYEAKGDTVKTMESYAECIRIGYDKPEIFRSLSTLQKRTGAIDAAIATTRAGLVKYPDDKELMLDLVAFQLDADLMEEAEASVQAAIKKDPTNPVLWSVLGRLYDGKANPQEGEVSEAEMVKWTGLAEEAYSKSIALDSTIFDTYYNLGVLYNNRAAYEYEKCAAIKDDVKYTKCKQAADALYLKTIPYFQKAHQLQPEDRMTMEQLKKLYAKTGDTVKYGQIKKELGE